MVVARLSKAVVKGLCTDMPGSSGMLALGLFSKGKKKNGKVKEKGTGEVYASKGTMKRHEMKESPAMEKSEYKRGGMAKKKPVAMKKGGMAKKKGC